MNDHHGYTLTREIGHVVVSSCTIFPQRAYFSKFCLTLFARCPSLFLKRDSIGVAKYPCHTIIKQSNRPESLEPFVHKFCFSVCQALFYGMRKETTSL